MIIGYARVSTKDQNLDRQIDALEKYGCERIYSDKYTGSTMNRKGFKEMENAIRDGDTLVILELYRLGRTALGLMKFVHDLMKRNIKFVSLQENFDTSTPMGKFIFNFYCMLGEMQLNIIKEATKSGLAAARARGRFGGRPKTKTKKEITLIEAAYKFGSLSIEEICLQFEISKGTFYNYKRKYFKSTQIGGNNEVKND